MFRKLRQRLKKGNWRYCLPLPELGIVIKFPRFRSPLRAMGGLRREVAVCRKHGWLGFNRENGPYRFLLGGVLHNWGEWTFYLRCLLSGETGFLVPTYVSVLGLINIQKLVVPMKKAEWYTKELYNNERWILEDRLVKLLGVGVVESDMHHLLEFCNFTRLPFVGEVKMIDYGSYQTRRILRRNISVIRQTYNEVFTAGD